MQVNNKNKHIGFSALIVDPKVWKSGSFILKSSLRQALPQIEKHSELCDIYIKYSSQDRLRIDVARKKYLGPLEKGNKKGFESFLENIRKPFIQGKFSWKTIKTPREEDVISAFNTALACCRSKLKRDLEKRFGTKIERALRNPEQHLDKLAKKENHAQKIRKQRVRDAILRQQLEAIRANRQRIEKESL